VQHLVHTKALSVQGTSALVPVDLEENSMDTKDNVKNEEFTKAEIFIRQSQVAYILCCFYKQKMLLLCTVFVCV
jgi:hypothetical protein